MQGVVVIATLLIIGAVTGKLAAYAIARGREVVSGIFGLDEATATLATRCPGG